MKFSRFNHAIASANDRLMNEGKKVEVERWQGYEAKGDPSLVTKELLNLQLEVSLDRPGATFWDNHTLVDLLRWEIEPNRRWADEHFEERVGGIPLNPDPSYERWPWWTGAGTQVATALSATGTKFTHTYSERFWPPSIEGIRYQYGDLADVVDLLTVEPYTRQAYLPIFFPEDTGCVHRGRIPCTLGYQFIRREDDLHMWYHIRSCDAVRHFRDDLYLAARLLLWMIDTLAEAEESWGRVSPGTLHFTAYSFHVHMGDIHRL